MLKHNIENLRLSREIAWVFFFQIRKWCTQAQFESWSSMTFNDTMRWKLEDLGSKMVSEYRTLPSRSCWSGTMLFAVSKWMSMIIFIGKPNANNISQNSQQVTVSAVCYSLVYLTSKEKNLIKHWTAIIDFQWTLNAYNCV